MQLIHFLCSSPPTIFQSYRDFHPDLFPDTRGSHAGCTSSEWLAGANTLVSFQFYLLLSLFQQYEEWVRRYRSNFQRL